MRKVVFFLSVYLFYTHAAFAQSACSIYHNGSLTPNMESNQSTNFIASSIDYKASPQELSELLNENSYFIDQQKDLLFFSFTQDKFSKTWEPFALNLKGKDLAKYTNCSELEKFYKNFRKIRIASKNILNRYTGHPTDLSLGESILTLESAYLKSHGNTDLNADTAVSKYKSIVAKFSQNNQAAPNQEKFFTDWKERLKIVYENSQEDIDYCAANTMLIDALLRGCTNCMGETVLFLSLFLDGNFKAPEGWELSVQMYKNHIAPILYNKELGETYDLAYGKFDLPKATIMGWKQYMKPILYGYNLGVHVQELNTVESGYEYTYKSIWCQLPYFDLGYQTRYQLPNVTGVKVCTVFPNAPQPGDAEEVDNEFRLKTPPEETEEGGEGSSAEESTGEGSLVGRTSIDNSARIEGEADGALYSEAYLEAKNENESDQQASILDKGLTLSVTTEGKGQSIEDFFRENYLPIIDNLSIKEQGMINSYLAGVGNGNELLNHFKISNLTDALGIQPRVIPKYDAYLEEARASTKLNHPLMPIRVELNTTQLLGIQLEGSTNTIYVSNEKLLLELTESSTVDRYLRAYKFSEEVLRNNTTKVLDATFNTNDLNSSLIAQNKYGTHLLSLMTQLEMPLRIIDQALWVIKQDWMIEYTFIPGIISDYNALITYKKYIAEHPMEFLDAIRATQQFLTEKDASFQPLFFPYEKSDPANHRSLYMFVKEDPEECSEERTPGERPKKCFFLGEYYNDFTNSMLFHDQFFFTAEATEEEIPEVQARPYSPITLEEALKKRRIYPDTIDVSIEANELGYYVQPCQEGQTGMVPAMAVWKDGHVSPTHFVIDCTNYADTETLVSNDKENERSQEGLEKGFDEEDIQGIEVAEEDRGLQAHELATEIVRSDNTEDVWTDQDFKANLIDPREEVVLEKELWEVLIPLIKPYIDTQKEKFAIHHIQRESIEDLIANNFSYSQRTLYNDLVGSPKLPAKELEKLKHDAFTMANPEDYVDRYVPAAQRIRDIEMESGAPIYLSGKLHLEIMYLGPFKKMKPEWHFRPLFEDTFEEDEYYHMFRHSTDKIRDSLLGAAKYDLIKR